MKGGHKFHGVEANRKELNFILILCGGSQVLFLILIPSFLNVTQQRKFCNLQPHPHALSCPHPRPRPHPLPRPLSRPCPHPRPRPPPPPPQAKGSQGGKVASDTGRQIRQADVMLKSAVLLTKRWQMAGAALESSGTREMARSYTTLQFTSQH